MENSFAFDWSNLIDVNTGREKLGREIPVFVYRLFEYTMREAISAKYGDEAGIEVFRAAGKIAGKNFYEFFLSDVTEELELIAKLQKILAEWKVGILRIESITDTGKIILTMSEDLECSGLPVMGKTICYYDEGFIAGILSSFFGKEYLAEEVDCWAKGDRVCKFEAYIKDGR